MTKNKGKVILCVPTVKRPYQTTLDAIEASVPVLDDAGWDHYMVAEVGNPYISNARIMMLRKALDKLPDVIVFIDHDVSWEPKDLLTLIETPGDVVAGTYRFTVEGKVDFMGATATGENGKPVIREDGCIEAITAPAGFLKITPRCVDLFMEKYPELCIGPLYHRSVDLFNHGAFEGNWWGEDYAFCRRWRALDEKLWIVPNLNITHWRTKEDGSLKGWPGNLHEWLLRLPGGKLEGHPYPWEGT